ncbi:unnamed protein product, partial [Prorocentrum cordatum]
LREVLHGHCRLSPRRALVTGGPAIGRPPAGRGGRGCGATEVTPRGLVGQPVDEGRLARVRCALEQAVAADCPRATNSPLWGLVGQ